MAREGEEGNEACAQAERWGNRFVKAKWLMGRGKGRPARAPGGHGLSAWAGGTFPAGSGRS